MQTTPHAARRDQAELARPAGLAELAEDVSTLEMVRPFLGFPERRRFALARLEETGTVCDLRSLEDPDLSFVVVPPGVFFGDYAPEVDESVADDLGAQGAEDLLVLVLLTLADPPGQATANLAAPIVVNHRNRRAAQVLLDDPTIPLRAPLAPAGHRAG